MEMGFEHFEVEFLKTKGWEWDWWLPFPFTTLIKGPTKTFFKKKHNVTSCSLQIIRSIYFEKVDCN